MHPQYTPAQVARFWMKVALEAAQSPGDCWLWEAGTNNVGYGRFAVTKHMLVSAHRFSWELANGPIPEGMCVLHRCDVRACVNPAHLFLGTRGDNNRDAVSKGRQARGERHGIARLTAEKARTIRTRYAAGEGSMHDLAVEYGVTDVSVFNVVHRRTWREA